MNEPKNIYNINKKTIYRVIIFHFIFILFLAFQFKSFKKYKKHNLIVNNVIETPTSKENFTQKDVIINKEPKSTKELSKVKPKNKEIQPQSKKIEKPKAISQKKTINTSEKKVSEKKIASKTSNKSTTYETLITKLEKQINEIDNSDIEVKVEEELFVPKNVKTLNVDKLFQSYSDQPPSKFKELLIKELQDNLNLPDYGSVKVSFTILPDGEIKDIVILEYQSNENQKYLKNSLSELSFKSINKMFDEPQKFIVIFKNEEL